MVDGRSGAGWLKIARRSKAAKVKMESQGVGSVFKGMPG